MTREQDRAIEALSVLCGGETVKVDPNWKVVHTPSEAFVIGPDGEVCLLGDRVDDPCDSLERGDLLRASVQVLPRKLRG